MNYCYNIVDESQKLCAERKKPYTQEDGLDDSILMTVSIRQNDHDKKEIRNFLELGWWENWREKDGRELFLDDRNVFILIVVVVIQIYTFVRLFGL